MLGRNKRRNYCHDKNAVIMGFEVYPFGKDTIALKV